MRILILCCLLVTFGIFVICAAQVKNCENDDENLKIHMQKILNSHEFSNEHDKNAAIKNLRRESELVTKNNEKFAEGKSNVKQAIYDFSYLSEEDFMEKYTGLRTLKPKLGEKRKSRDVFEKCDNLPVTVNWEAYGKVLEAKDQKGCGSSYLQAAISAVEAKVAIDYETIPEKLSTQHVLECVKNITDGDLGGCDGGYSELIWRQAKEQGGLVAEAGYKAYNGDSRGECVGNLPRDSRAEVDYWSLLSADNEEALKCHVARHGPVVVGISIAGTSLPRYKEGIFDDFENACTASNPINHAVLVTGYGSETNQEGVVTNYWLVQNSWGTDWGIKGSFKILRGRNLCKIARYPRFPVLKPKPNTNILKQIITPSICDGSFDIFTANSYQKSYCAVKIPQTYEDARVTCLKNGMRLFHVNASDTFQFDFKKIGLKADAKMFVDGRNESGCNCTNNNNEIKLEHCGQLTWSFCEYLNIDPFIQLNQPISKPEICTETALVYNKLSGYFKTLCFMQQNKNYEEALDVCSSNGMQLYQIDSKEAERAIMDFTGKLMLKTSNSLHVKGRKEGQCASISKDFEIVANGYGSCSKQTWFYCEFIQSSPPENFLLPMYPSPECVSTGEVYTSNVYNRSFCLIEKPLNYDEARHNCLALGMRLFTITSTDDINALLSYSQKRWKTNVVMAHIGRDDLSLCTNINNNNGSFLFETKNCLALAYSFCEYIDIESEPPLSPIQTPCAETHDVFNSIGVYDKTMCLVNKPKNYSEAWKHCLDHGMQLYRIESADTRAALLNFANRKCTKTAVNTIFFKGRRGSDCSVINRAQGIFFENYGKCDQPSWSICEFISKHVPVRSIQLSNPKVRPAICATVGDILNSFDAYQKSFCIVEWSQNYEKSRDHCVKNGMKLFKFDSAEANKTVVDYANKFIQRTSYFWLDGSAGNGCFNINNFDGRFSAKLSDCSSLMYSICEYFDEPTISTVSSQPTIVTSSETENNADDTTTMANSGRSLNSESFYTTIHGEDSTMLGMLGLGLLSSEETSTQTTVADETTYMMEFIGKENFEAAIAPSLQAAEPPESLSQNFRDQFKELKKQGLLYSQEMLKFASTIKDHLSKHLSKEENHEILALVSELPLSVRILIWNEEVVITNEFFVNESLYASTFFKDDNRRFVFTWIPGGDNTTQFPFVFSTLDNGTTFKVKSSFANEYLYPDSTFKDDARRHVFTWRKQTLESDFFWNVELLSNDKIRLKKPDHNEYLYAENSTYSFTENRRSIFVGLSAETCGKSCNWIVSVRRDATVSPTTTLYDELENELFRLKANNLTLSHEIFTVASKIKKAMTMDLSRRDSEKFAILKSQLPKSVQILIWSVQTVIYNEAYPNEFLYAANVYRGDFRRHAFIWIPGGHPDSQSPWVFATDNKGASFTIKSIFANEYFFPDDSLSDGESKKNVYLWRQKSFQESFFWNIEILGDTKIRIKSANMKDYLYAFKESHQTDRLRRLVYTGLKEDTCGTNCNWILRI